MTDATRESLIKPKNASQNEQTISGKTKTNESSGHGSYIQVESNPFLIKLEFNMLVVVLFLIAFGLRVYELDQPTSVVFDELHYGRFVSLYLKRIFFFDSQPPLGKQLISLSALLSGYKGNFADNFTSIGQEYESNVPIFALRFVPALCGALLVPVVYHIVIELGLNHLTGLLTSILLICENSILTQSRFILLDTILMFFSFSGILAYLIGRRKHPFSIGWFTWMCIAGLLLACGVCVKYIGIFTLIQVQVMAFADVYIKIAKKSIRTLHLWLQFLYYALVFVILPIIIYCLIFYIHLSILIRAGPHDNIMTSAFQASLDGGLASIIRGQPRDIAHGSQITLRNTHGRTCWVHSHQAVYPIRYADQRGSSHQQQVTCYSFKDVNNWWIVKRPNVEELVTTEPRDNIKDGDIIQLIHGLSGRALNSHDIAAPMSPFNQEVSCYIDYNISMPAQNLWKVKLINAGETNGYWHAINSRLLLIHVNTSQALKLSGLQLADWGFHQHEVVTDKQINHQNAIWNVEEHRYTKNTDEKEIERELGMAEFMPLNPTSLSFWSKMAELQFKMLVVNPENVQNHMYSTESPFDWPLLTKGIAYWLNPKSNAQIYLIGNITIWYLGLVSIGLYLAFLAFYSLRRARLIHDIDEGQWNRYLLIGQVAACGYFLHFLPYFLSERTLFLHHYFPALLFKIILIASLAGHFEQQIGQPPFVVFFYVALISAVAYTFFQFLPLSYGLRNLTSAEVLQLKWRKTWHLLIHK